MSPVETAPKDRPTCILIEAWSWGPNCCVIPYFARWLEPHGGWDKPAGWYTIAEDRYLENPVGWFDLDVQVRAIIKQLKDEGFDI